MNDFGRRLLVLWYRLLGSTPTQAEWRARRAAERPSEAGRAVRSTVGRAADRRFQCVCGQLLVDGDKVCHACGRRQLMPAGLRRVLRLFGFVVPEAVPGTVLVLGLCLLGYAFQVKVGGGKLFQPSSSVDLLDVGASFSTLTIGSQPWRSISYVFLHGNLIHLIFNLLALVQVGPLVENRFGTGRFLLAWVVGGAVAVLVPPLVGVERGVPVVGASGAVFTLIGMALLRGHLDGDARGRMIRDVMIRWALYTTAFGLLAGGVAHGAHFGGLGAGLLLALVLPPPDGRPAARRVGPWLGGLAALALVAGPALLFAWRADGALPPRGAPARLSLQWMSARVDRHGAEAALDDAGRALLREAGQITDPTAQDAFLRRVERYAAERSVGPALVLLTELSREAPPDLRPRYHAMIEPRLALALEEK